MIIIELYLIESKANNKLQRGMRKAQDQDFND